LTFVGKGTSTPSLIIIGGVLQIIFQFSSDISNAREYKEIKYQKPELIK